MIGSEPDDVVCPRDDLNAETPEVRVGVVSVKGCIAPQMAANRIAVAAIDTDGYLPSSPV
ncbi:hypothetical protein [Rathayibacter tritici]|uniref:hypothetical protein n=1 Tax=Rathayibacter tritici TaxID=33888 RepID=UPI00082E9787|nr:hypothetical protein [Rathayibacter tritici]